MNIRECQNQSWPVFMSMLDPLHLKEPASQPPQPQPHPQPQPQQEVGRTRKKLRESCNNCALSKVKCSKDQPTCVRCEDRRIYCHYSFSQRTGKRRASSSLASSLSSSRGTSSTTVALETVTPQSITPPDKVQQAQTRTFESLENNGHENDNGNPKGSPLHTALIDVIVPTPLEINRDCTELQMNKMLNEALLPWDDTMFGINLDGSGGIFDYSMLSRTPSDGCGFFTGKSSHQDMTMLDQSNAATGTHRPLSSPSNFDAVNSILGICTQSNTCPPPTPTPIPCSLHRRSNTQNSAIDFNDGKLMPDTSQPQDCMTLAVLILQNLHMRPSTCTFAQASRSSSSSTADSDMSLRPTIDHVLSTNKAIIDSLNSILNCACSLDTQLALLLTHIASKIIGWYSAVGRDDSEEDAGGPNTTLRSSTPIATAERVSNLPVTVGKYHLDGAHKSKMRAQLVLSELHRVVRLVEQLSKRFGEATPGAREGVGSSNGRDLEGGTLGDSDSICSSMRGALEGFLKHRVRCVTRETMAVLRDMRDYD